jgi:hypothetical protein
MSSLPRRPLPLDPACSRDGLRSGGDSTAPNNPPPSSNLPAELLGEWHYQFLGDVNCDPSTGQCASTSNQSETLKLSSYGQFEHVFVGESNFPPCSMEVLHQSEGTAEVQGANLLLHMRKGTTSGRCYSRCFNMDLPSLALSVGARRRTERQVTMSTITPLGVLLALSLAACSDSADSVTGPGEVKALTEPGNIISNSREPRPSENCPRFSTCQRGK